MENRITWQVTKGCERLSAGCDSCPSYLHSVKTGESYSVQLHPDELSLPSKTKTPSVFAVAFGSDLFHESVSLDFIKKVFIVMNENPQHVFELVTKRIKRAYVLSERFEWTDNIRLGTVVESSDYEWRVRFLQMIPNRFKFISASPLLGDISDINLTGIDFVGAVAESWGDKRLCKQGWVDDLSDSCEQQGVDFQYGNVHLWSAE